MGTRPCYVRAGAPRPGLWLAPAVTEQPFARVERVRQAPSTNTALREAASADPAAWPHLSVLLTPHQTAGRGRAGRGWETPAGAALTASVLLRPRVPLERAAWLTQLTGLAVVRAVRTLAPDRAERVGLKWPNDVLLDDAGPVLPGWGTARKLGGILTELLPGTDRPAVVVGIGVNLTQDAGELPVPSATSLALAGLPVPTAEELLRAVGTELAALLAGWEAHAGDAVAAGLRDAVSAACLTLGRAVRAEQPGREPLPGVAEAIDPDGSLVVRDAAGARHRVRAGDVLHVRADGP